MTRDCKKTPLENPSENEWSEDGAPQQRSEQKLFFIGPNRRLPKARSDEQSDGEV
jgi:hypothetical protein